MPAPAPAPLRLLVPVDFSEATADLVDTAARLARERGQGLTLLHVLDLPVLARPEALVKTAPGTGRTLEALAREQAELELGHLGERAARLGVDVELAVEVGEVAEAVVAAARRRLPQCIVMATHGRTGAARVFLGSVAERVVARAPCPVLTFRLDVLRERAAAARAAA